MLAQQAQAIALNFGNTPTGQISFDGASHFDFPVTGVAGPANNSFKITGVTGGAGTSVGFFGTMTGPAGGWTFDGAGNVTGSGTLDVFDGSAHLTAALTWSKLTVNGPGTGGQLNEFLTANLTGITYSGADPDLIALAGPGFGTETLSWTFPTGGHFLSNLASVAQTTSFSGSLETTPPPLPDGGMTVALLGLAFLGVEGLRRKLS
jgi:hypothetical protein